MKRITPLFFSLLVFLTSSPIFATESWREHSYDVQHYRIDLRFNMKQGLVIGNTSIIIKALRNNLNHISLDAREFDVKAVLVNDQPVDTFSVTRDNIVIRLGRVFDRDSIFQVTVGYSCRPQKGLYFLRPDSAHPDQPTQIWSQGEGQDNHYWFPCYDAPNDKATMEMSVTVDSGLTAISNGILAGQIERGNQTIFYYRFDQPTPAYLISLIVGKYIKYEQNYKDIPVEYFVYPQCSKEDVLRSFGRTPDMLRFFSKYTGFEYPYPQYAQTLISNFMYSGMENISATTLTDRTIHDQRAHLDFESDGLVAHELAHQWFGDLVTCRDWDDTWLNEGFATYFTDLYYEHWKGKNAFRYRVWEHDQLPVIRAELKKPRTLSAQHPWGVYIKGASVLHMLRAYLGDDLFRAGIKTYLQRHAFANAETCDLRQALEDASGYNLYEFFKQWVYGRGIPHFKVAAKYDGNRGQLQVSVSQIQDSLEVRSVFDVHLLIGITDQNGYHSYPIHIKKRKDQFRVPCKGKPRMVVFDAGQNILKTLSFEQPVSQLIYQYAHAPAMIDRLVALDQLVKLKKRDDAEALAEAIKHKLLSTDYYGVRRETARRMKRFKLFTSAQRKRLGQALVKSLRNAQKSVLRQDILAAMVDFPSTETVHILQHYFKKDSSYAVQARALELLVKADSSHAVRYIRRGLAINSWDEQIRASALESLKQVSGSLALQIAGQYVFYGTHPRLRSVAVRIVDSLAVHGKEQAKLLLLDVIKKGHEQNRYRPVSSAIRTMSKLKDVQLVPLLKNILAGSRNRYLLQSARNALKRYGMDN